MASGVWRTCSWILLLQFGFTGDVLPGVHFHCSSHNRRRTLLVTRHHTFITRHASSTLCNGHFHGWMPTLHFNRDPITSWATARYYCKSYASSCSQSWRYTSAECQSPPSEHKRLHRNHTKQLYCGGEHYQRVFESLKWFQWVLSVSDLPEDSPCKQ
jgi:hypothetical protein